jgi:hypothetical protein
VLISELLRESQVTDEINNDLMDFIVTYRSKNKPWAPMTGPNGAVAYMKKLHHDVNANDLMQVLSQPPFTDVVERSGPKHIKIKTSIPDTLSDKAAEKEQEQIAKTADKEADKAVKSGQLAV